MSVTSGRLAKRLFFTLHSSSLCVSTLGLKVDHHVLLPSLVKQGTDPFIPKISPGEKESKGRGL